MKVSAYKCNCCNKLYEIEYIFGVSNNIDAIDILLSYSLVHPDKTNIHYCVSCANDRVIEPAKKIADRATEGEKYDRTVKELFYILRKSLFSKKM